MVEMRSTLTSEQWRSFFAALARGQARRRAPLWKRLGYSFEGWIKRRAIRRQFRKR